MIKPMQQGFEDFYHTLKDAGEVCDPTDHNPHEPGSDEWIEYNVGWGSAEDDYFD